ncbi:MAG: Gfo/Idh/MocA family oxidoreductase, partial [Ruminococcaceae bacterium]|nr:Gfo/Idh/MocA family oxidoreductase [Oscillospiraceae bacterium]
MMKKYVLCGASGRGYKMYAENIVHDYADIAVLAGIFDINPMRAEFVRDCVDDSKTIPVYTDFDQMIKDTSPDTVIVTTMDSFHHEYVVRSLDCGCDVICEKPMTIDAEKTREIFEAEKRNNRKIIVTFNCRFMPFAKRIKEIIRSGAIGQVLSVDFEWLLDQHHGADYFRRWHKFLKNGGGLLVTKATHHFDLINWWIEKEPVKVYANGELSFYGPKREERAERCSKCPYRKSCEFVMSGFDDLNGVHSDDFLNKMYFEPEKIDGYMRDQCVFAPSDIYDNMSLSVRYTDGVLMTYSLNAYMPYEGWRVAINGTKGRLEAQEFSDRAPDADQPKKITIYTPDNEKTVHYVPKATGSHGGGDKVLLNWLFREKPEDPLNQSAGSREGALS